MTEQATTEASLWGRITMEHLVVALRRGRDLALEACSGRFSCIVFLVDMRSDRLDLRGLLTWLPGPRRVSLLAGRFRSYKILLLVRDTRP